MAELGGNLFPLIIRGCICVDEQDTWKFRTNVDCRSSRLRLRTYLSRYCVSENRFRQGGSQVAVKAGIKAGVAFVMDGQEVASVCVAPLKGRDRAVEKAENMPIGPDKDRTEGPAIAWVRLVDLKVFMLELCA